ncbi:MAG: polysaccharide deacetylase family protein, partial [Bacteroidetes bacterium]|nr:polysaccharide deacetylase family protein [Bacteroidota bacterium]
CNDGHEVATHSYWHRKVYELTAKEFYKDLKRSIDVIEQQSGQKVKGFRAPSFSIIPGCEWAFDVLWDLGIEYDASLFPSKRSPACVDASAGRHLTSYPGVLPFASAIDVLPAPQILQNLYRLMHK